MSENNQRLYQAKKMNLFSSSRTQVNDVENALERARSSSPKPREACDLEKKECEKRKVAYKHELSSVVDTLNDVQKKLNDLSSNLENQKSELLNYKQCIDNLESSLKKNNSEQLKTVVNDAVRGFNENTKKVASEMVSHLDSINELKSRVETIENML
jgi:methyl-accepting chemotaxis protein